MNLQPMRPFLIRIGCDVCTEFGKRYRVRFKGDAAVCKLGPIKRCGADPCSDIQKQTSTPNVLVENRKGFICAFETVMTPIIAAKGI